MSRTSGRPIPPGIALPPPPPGWSAADLDTLAEVAETFVRGGAKRRALLAAATLDDVAAPEQVDRIRHALAQMRSRRANLTLAGRPVRFSDLDPLARERYLIGWATSRSEWRRTAFQALKRLLCFLAYADPGEDPVRRPNPHWRGMGYTPAIEPVTAEPAPIRAAELPPAGPDGTVTLDADVAIVGSGAGGGVVAAALAAAGRSVVILEAGDLVPEPEMPVDELSAFDRLYLDHGTTSTTDASVSILSGATVGGGTVVNWTTCIAPPDFVRHEWAKGHGVEGFDGPRTDDDLVALAGELGLSDGPGIPPKDTAILAGARSLGYEVAPTRRDARGCGDCGSCGFGCRRGAKRSGLRGHLADAYRGGARIVPRAEVVRIIFEGRRAAGVEARLRPAGGLASGSSAGARAIGGPAQGGDGRRLVVHAPTVVVAAGALRTPAVLERSGIEHPAVGRNLHLHPIAVLGARFREPVDMWHGTMQAVRSLEFLGPRDGRGGFIVESAPGHPGLVALAFPWEGTEAHAAMLAGARHWAPLLAIARDRESGRVRLSPSGRVLIDYRVGERDAATLRRGLVTVARMARAAGADEMVALGTPAVSYGRYHGPAGDEGVAFDAFLRRLAAFDFAPGRAMILSAHQMGTARMGANPAHHVCDPEGRVRAAGAAWAGDADRVIRGLYVADASLFPTAVGVNPMMTVMALARRVARTILADG